MGKSTISMAIFNSYVKLPEGKGRTTPFSGFLLFFFSIGNTQNICGIYVLKRGLVQLPLDGNPNKCMGLIAHPGQIASISVDYQGQYAFTCGGSDLTVNQWLIDPQPVANASVMGGGGIEPFVKLLDGGEDGAFFCDMKEGFFFGSCRLVIFINWKSGVAIVTTITLTIMLIYTLFYTYTLPILRIATATKETAIALFPRQRCATQQFSMPGLFLLLADQISG